MVGGSVFYAAEAQESSGSIDMNKTAEEDAVEHLDKELQESEQRRLEAECLEQQLSSLVWICTSTQKMSKVTVIDANNPADILEVFNVCESHLLCIASIPGAKESDYQSLKEVDGQAEFALGDDEADTEPESKTDEKTNEQQNKVEVDAETINLGKVRFISSATSISPEFSQEEESEENIEAPIEKMSSVQPTMWLGAQDGAVFVHSAVAKWSVCLHSVKLPDAALSIVYVYYCILSLYR